MIIPLIFPIESALAALEYKAKHKNIIILPYYFDNFTASSSIHKFLFIQKLKFNRHKKLEKSIIDNSKIVLAMNSLKGHLSKYYSEIEKDKIKYVEHPLLVEKKLKSCNYNNDKIICTYAGSLLKGIREPTYFFKIINGLDKKNQIQFNFYTLGNCNSEVEYESIKNHKSIKSYGSVEKSIADEAITKSNILINIGEIAGKQISSKIFEYMSIGKPIVHFAYSETDVVISVLNKYPLALCLLQNEGNLRENCKKFEDFVIEHKNSNLSFEKVKNIFPEALPITTANIIKKIVEENEA